MENESLTEYELKQQQKAEKEKLNKHASGGPTRWGKGLAVLFVFVLIVGGIFFWIQRSFVASGVDYSKQYENLGQDHIKIGEAHKAYNSNPPSSGPHYEEPAQEGYYDAELPDEQLVHNLEHGDIWIAYHPRISQEMKDALKQFDASKVIITPRAKNDTDIALVAWTRVDAFNIENGKIDRARIEDFIKRYINTGPEKLIPSNHK